MEVDQKAGWLPAQTQIGEQLCFVNRHHRGDRLDLDHHKVFDNQVYSIPCIERNLLVDDRKLALGYEPQFAKRQFLLKTGKVDRFEEPRTKHAVYFDCGTNDLPRDYVERPVDEHEHGHSKSDVRFGSGQILTDRPPRRALTAYSQLNPSTKNLRASVPPC